MRPFALPALVASLLLGAVAASATLGSELAALALALLAGAVVGLALARRATRRELCTDPLTGLGNRRALAQELAWACERASEEEPVFVWFFDLNGFKQYNDSFGHVSGDALLERLGARLARVVAPFGRGYRLDGDEFCVLITTPVRDPHALFQRARAALAEQGGGFTVTASGGAVELPREASTPTRALRLADHRMYREKAISRTGGVELITAVLQAALAQRQSELAEHSNDVAGDVQMLARRIGLDDEAIGQIVKAGDLHDIGKLGIPDEILIKPGPLSAEEWEFMKRHTSMGEQYPDHLAGEQIPLGARIIAICDSFRAMIDARVYKKSMSIEDALAELRRCAGTQFDPNLVEVFRAMVSERMTRDRMGSTAP